MKIRYPTRCTYGGETINVGSQATRYAGGYWCYEHYMEYVKARAAAIEEGAPFVEEGEQDG